MLANLGGSRSRWCAASASPTRARPVLRARFAETDALDETVRGAAASARPAGDDESRSKSLPRHPIFVQIAVIAGNLGGMLPIVVRPGR